MQTQQNYYSAPTRSTFVAYTCAALMIFFVVILCMLYQETENLQQKTLTLGIRIDKLEKQNRKLTALQSRPLDNQLALSLPLTKPATITSPTRKVIAKVAATRPTSHQTAANRKPTRKIPSSEVKPNTGINTGDISTLRAPNYVSPSTARDTTPGITPELSSEKPVNKPSAPKLSTKQKSVTTIKTADMTNAHIKTGITVQGKILATNQSQMRVILSLGSNNAIQVGNRFNVYRNDRWVGEIVVAKVFADMSMCEIKSSPRGIRVEDIAKAAAKSSR